MRKKLALFTCFYLTVSANCATFPALSNDFGKGDVPGIIGRGITVGYDQKTQKSVVLAADKFSPAAGSCSFWIKPLDWTPADAPFCIFMTARGKDYRFMVFKQARGTLLVLVNFKGMTFKTTANISKWQKKQWHQITVIWSPGALHLYVDGNLNNSCDYPAVDSSFKVNQLTAGTLCWKAESGFSVIDEFKLFSAPLKDAEIQDSYQELASLTSASFDPFEVTVSPGKVKIDGAVSAGEYLSSFTGWYIPNGGFSDDAGSVHLASAKEKLFLALDYPRYAVPVLYTVKKDGRRVLQDSLSWQGKLPGTVETEIPFSDSDAGIFLQLAGKNGVEREIVPGDAGFLKINTVSKSMPFRIFKLGEINKGELNIFFESSLKNTVAEISFADDRRCSFSEKMKFSDGKLNFKRRFAPDGRFCILLTGEGKTLFKAEIPAERSSRVTVTGFHTNIAKRTLELVFNKFRRNTAGCVMLTMKHLKSGKVYEKNIPVPGEKMKFSVSWPLVKMPDGDYVFKAQYVDETGKKGTPFERLYMVCASKAEWEDNRIGIYPGMVPSPWTPLKKLDNGLRMCMQEYRFGSGLFFDSIKSLGRELLAGPAVLRVNGKNVAAGEGTWLSFAPDTARFRQTGNAGDFDVSLDTCGEYDGLLKQSLRIKGNGTINSLQLEIPLKPKFCRQVYNNDRKGAVSGPGATGSIPASGWSRNLYDLPAVWVGNEQAGISWCAETLKNWSNRDRNKCIEIKPGKNSSRFILNLVDRPLKINGERIYEFYFQATPVRPGTGINPLKRINREILSVRGEKYFNYLRSGTEFFDEKKLVNNMALARARGVEKFLYYVNSAAIGTFTPEWAWWAEKWNARGTGRQVVEHNISDQEVRNRRIYSDCCLNSKSFSDFMIWQVSKIFTDSRFRTKNVYFDSAGPRLCRQKDHGCSWVDEDGKLHPTLVIDATRNFFKRIKHFAAEKAPQALFFHHASGMAGITACRSFADAFVGGENMYQGALVRKGSYIGVFDQDYFSTAFSGEKWGYPIYFIPQQLRAALMFRPQNAELWKKTPLAAPQRRSMRHIIGCFLVHGTSVWVRDQAVAEIQQPVHDLMLKTFGTLQGVQFVSQQSGNQPFKVKSDSRELRSGAYVKGNKCLVVLFNDTDRETGCSLLGNKEQKNLKVPPRDFVLEVFEIL